jgi:peptide/nickel transport system substrate-binding protein
MKSRVAAVTVVAAVVALAAGLVSRSDASPRAGISVLRVGIPFSVSNLDPGRPSQGNGAELNILLLEGLVALGPDGKVQPSLATSWSRPDPTDFVFRLRRGVKFWDGTEMTSADVVNALNYYRYPEFQAEFGDAYTRVRSVKPAGRYTVVVVLRKPNAAFLYQLANTGRIFEKRQQLQHPIDFGKPGTLVVGTGPWKITKLDATSGAELVANPRYWGGKVGIARISYKFFKDETSEALAFRAGDIDVVPRVSGQRAFAATANTALLSGPSCREAYLFLNTKVAPWNDVHVRRAVAYAINREDVIAGTVGAGFAKPEYTLVTPFQLRLLGSAAQVNAALKSIPKNDLDLAKAKAELAQSAYPNGFSFDFPAGNLTVWPLGTQIVAAQLAKIGIKGNVSILSLGAWAGQVYGPPEGRPVSFVTSGCSDDPNYYFTEPVGSKGSNFSNYTGVDGLIAQALITLDPVKRLAVYTRILRKLAADVPVVPIFNQLFSSALSNRLTWSGHGQTTYFSGQPWALSVKAR